MSGCPESILESSTTLSAPLTGGALATVRPSASAFATSTWLSAKAATWARWVTTRTWWSPPRAASARPTARAASPRPGIDLVENKRGRCRREHETGGEHRSGELASRGDLGKWQCRLAGIGAEEELDRRSGRVIADEDLEAPPAQCQLLQVGLDGSGQLGGGLAPRRRGGAPRPRAGRRRSPAARETGADVLCSLELGELGPFRLRELDDIAERGPVLAAQLGEELKAPAEGF